MTPWTSRRRREKKQRSVLSITAARTVWLSHDGLVFPSARQPYFSNTLPQPASFGQFPTASLRRQTETPTRHSRLYVGLTTGSEALATRRGPWISCSLSILHPLVYLYFRRLGLRGPKDPRNSEQYDSSRWSEQILGLPNLQAIGSGQAASKSALFPRAAFSHSGRRGCDLDSCNSLGLFEICET